MTTKLVAYHRVSTAKQGSSGLGIDAQQAAIEAYRARIGASLMASYTEVESGKNNERPELLKALHHAKVTGSVLVIAKLDRLSRSVAFLAALQDSGVKFVAADMPEANEVTIHIMAAIAQAERKAIGERTRVALQAAKARGKKLGNPNGAAALLRAGKGNTAGVEAVKAKAQAHAVMVGKEVARLQAEGVTSLGGLAAALNAMGAETPRGGSWHKTSVSNLLARLAA